MGKKVVVIGGGLGGISAAITCATEGFDVALYEKNERLGGKLESREREGFTFDLGPSLIVLPHLLRRLFDRAGKRMADYFELYELQPQWRGFFEDGSVLDLHGDMRLMERELEKLGEDAEGYWSFIEYSRRLWKFAEESYLERGADSFAEVMRGFTVAEVARGTDLGHTVQQGVARYVKDPNLRHMLAFFVRYVGSSPYDAPALFNLLAYAQLGYGLWYPKGGGYSIIRGSRRLMEELGVEIHTSSEVVSIRRDGKRVSGVELASGESIPADVIVSNMEVLPTYERLLGERRGAMMARYQYMYEPSASGLVLHLGTDRRYPQLAHYNFFFAAGPEKHMHGVHRKKELPEDPDISLACPTRTDPDLAPDGGEVLNVLTHVPHIQKKPFTTVDYLALKERVLDKLERMGLEDLENHVVVEDYLVPDDFERRYSSTRGSLYGVASDWRRNFGFKAPKRSEKYENLFFAGGTVNPGAGASMVALCGQNVGHQITRLYG